MKELINTPSATLLDVRTPSEFESFAISGSVNIPLHEIPNSVDQIKQLSTPIIVYCQAGVRSDQAVQYLKAQGVEDIHDASSVSNVHLMLL